MNTTDAEEGRTMTDLMTPAEVAESLHVSKRTALRAPLPWVKLSARCYRLRAADLSAYIARHCSAA